MGVRKLVVIDLTGANLALFESYERKVLPLLSKYNGKLELSVRSVDGSTETHALYFPDAVSFDGFIADPSRTALKDEWTRVGVSVTISDVVQVNYL